MHRKASNTEMYQLIRTEDDRLLYAAYSVTGELYDAFELHKDAGGNNTLVNANPERPGY
ncbi:hypothetical protein [Cyclobacterium plantarum]|uniref:Uncharacterized protein n=1 Tax=Cyclobacterium plantarum TaxID=2716263 RepID=A0ABX0HG31_9BACT|nr:hypothetical protein [Cyclobacterium plantarum]NHE59086.1 hypothetical protein [Cyclobacterium plantarum]